MYFISVNSLWNVGGSSLMKQRMIGHFPKAFYLRNIYEIFGQLETIASSFFENEKGGACRIIQCQPGPSINKSPIHLMRQVVG